MSIVKIHKAPVCLSLSWLNSCVKLKPEFTAGNNLKKCEFGQQKIDRGRQGDDGSALFHRYHRSTPMNSYGQMPCQAPLCSMASTSTASPIRMLFSLLYHLPFSLTFIAEDVLESRTMSRRSMEELRKFEREPQRSRPYTGKSGFVWPFHKAEITIQLPLKEKSRSSLPPGASKLRVVGRGGSGSQLRQVSLSNPAVLDAEPQPDVHHHPRHLPEAEPSASPAFYRPTGRGGLGSLSTRPPTPLKPPVVIQSLLRGRKRRRTRSEEQCTIYEEPSSTIPQNTDPGQDEDTIDEICPTCHEHRQRSLNQLTRTPGAVLSPRQLAKRPATFKNSSETSISTDLDSSGGSLPHDEDNSTPTDDSNFTNDLAQSWSGMDTRSSFESDKHSPMTSLLPSALRGENMHHTKRIPNPHIDSDNSTTMTSPTTRKDKFLASKEPSSSSTTHIYVSNHSTSHFDKVSSDNDPFLDLSGYDAQCDWLVPLDNHNDELVISIARGAPSKTQSWTGEWNEDIQDVIKNLRRL